MYKYLDSGETLDYFGNLFALNSKERRKRAEQLLDMVGLKSVQMRTVGEFSKGMQRRIGLAQALINDPDLVILDEPTSGLDPIGCREMKDLILTLAERGKTIILSSHLLSDVEDVCDRAVIYYGGKVQAIGELKDLLCEQDSVRITLPVLPKDKMEKILQVIRQDVADGEVDVDNPTQNLESYFLQKVNEAKESDEDTSGATSGSQVAEYLRGDQTVRTAVDKKLARLAAPAEPKKAEPKPEAEPKKKVDEAKLQKLASTDPAPKASEKAEPKQVAKKVDNKKLSALLGSDDKDKK